MADNKIYLYSSSNNDFDAADKRKIAVEAALEVIRAAAGAGDNGPTYLENHINNLSKYADQIQAALKVNQ